jgi:hypothetical protein
MKKRTVAVLVIMAPVIGLLAWTIFSILWAFARVAAPQPAIGGLIFLILCALAVGWLLALQWAHEVLCQTSREESADASRTPSRTQPD